jgi:hypothetical protein
MQGVLVLSCPSYEPRLALLSVRRRPNLRVQLPGFPGQRAAETCLLLALRQCKLCTLKCFLWADERWQVGRLGRRDRLLCVVLQSVTVAAAWRFTARGVTRLAHRNFCF